MARHSKNDPPIRADCKAPSLSNVALWFWFGAWDLNLPRRRGCGGLQNFTAGAMGPPTPRSTGAWSRIARPRHNRNRLVTNSVRPSRLPTLAPSRDIGRREEGWVDDEEFGSIVPGCLGDLSAGRHGNGVGDAGDRGTAGSAGLAGSRGCRKLRCELESGRGLLQDRR